MEHRQVIACQQYLFIVQTKDAVRQTENCEDVNQANAGQAEQVNKERQQGRALVENLMTIVCSSYNLKQAYKRVKRKRRSRNSPNANRKVRRLVYSRRRIINK
jgi:hypothetical protein